MGEPAEDPRNWRGLHKAALFETDASKLQWRYDGETEAIEDALYALQALENCLRSNTTDRRHAPRIA